MNKKNEISSSLVSLLSSVLAFLGIVSCCGFPLLAAGLAWLGIGASQLNFLSQYQWLFISISIVALIYGFYTVYFKKPKSTNCCDTKVEEQTVTNSCCTKTPRTNLFAKTMLWIGLTVILSTFFMNRSTEKSSEENCCPAPKEQTVGVEDYPQECKNKSKNEATPCCKK